MNEFEHIKKHNFKIAREIIDKFGNLSSYNMACGVTPSGSIHLGTIREFLFCVSVSYALHLINGAKSMIYFIIDDYDPLNKIPSGFDISESEKDRAIYKVKCKDGSSLNVRVSDMIKKSIALFTPIGADFLNVKFVSNYEYCKAGKFADSFDIVFDNYRLIKVKMDEFGIKNFLPLIPCENDKILRDVKFENLKPKKDKLIRTDEDKIYETKDLKMPFRLDWPLRWLYFDIKFEGMGKDVSSIYESSKTLLSALRREKEMPILKTYEFFVTEDGKKISKSTLKDKMYTLDGLLNYFTVENIMMYCLWSPNRSNVVSNDRIMKFGDKLHTHCGSELSEEDLIFENINLVMGKHVYMPYLKTVTEIDDYTKKIIVNDVNYVEDFRKYLNREAYEIEIKTLDKRLNYKYFLMEGGDKDSYDMDFDHFIDLLSSNVDFHQIIGWFNKNKNRYVKFYRMMFGHSMGIPIKDLLEFKRGTILRRLREIKKINEFKYIT